MRWLTGRGPVVNQPRRVTDIEAWAAEHGADRHDLTPAQAARSRQYARLVNAGLDPSRVAFARYLAEHERIGR